MSKVYCPICNKSYDSKPEYCTYCNSSFNDISDTSSFHKIKSVLGIGFSKKDKQNYEIYLDNSKTKINDFINKFDSDIDNLIDEDSLIIKTDFKDIYDKLLEIKDFEDNSNQLSLEYKKIVFRFLRVYSELDSIIFDINNNYLKNKFKENKSKFIEFNNIFSKDIPDKKFLDSDKKNIKNNNSDLINNAKLFDKFYKKDSNYLSKNQYEIISNYISNYNNFDENIDKLNHNLFLNENLNKVKEIYRKVSKSNDIDVLKKEKEDYKYLYDIDELSDNNEFKKFKEEYNSLDSKIERLEIEKWCLNNDNLINGLNVYETKNPSTFVSNLDIIEIKNNFKESYEYIKYILSLNLESNVLNFGNLNKFVDNYDNFDEIIKESNCYFKINKSIEKLNSAIEEIIKITDLSNSNNKFNGFDFYLNSTQSKYLNFLRLEKEKYVIDLKISDNLINNYEDKIKISDKVIINDFKKNYKKLEDKIDNLSLIIYLSKNISKLENFNNYKYSNDNYFDKNSKKSLKKDFFKFYDSIPNNDISDFFSEDDLTIINDFKYNFVNFDKFIDDINFNYILNSILDKIENIILINVDVDIKDAKDTISNLNKHKLDYKELYDDVKNILKEYDYKLSAFENNQFKSFIDYYESISNKITKLNIDLFISKNITVITEFNNLKNNYSHHISTKEKNKIKESCKSIFNDLTPIINFINQNKTLFDNDSVNEINDFIDNYNNFDKIVESINCRYKLNNLMLDVNLAMEFDSSKLKELEEYKSDYENLFNQVSLVLDSKCMSWIKSEESKLFNLFISKFEDIKDKIYEIKISNFLNINLDKIISFNKFFKNDISKKITEKLVKSYVLDFKQIYECILKIKSIYNSRTNLTNFNLMDLEEFITIYVNIEDISNKLNYELFIRENNEDINYLILFKDQKIDDHININERDEIKSENRTLYDYLINIVKFNNKTKLLDSAYLVFIKSFIEVYENIDFIIDKFNIDFWIKENIVDITKLSKFDSKKPNHYIFDEEKEERRNYYSDIYNKLNEILFFYKKHNISNLDEINLFNKFISNYENYDELVNQWNVNYWLNQNRDKLIEFSEIGNYPPTNYYSHNNKNKLLKSLESVTNEVKKLNKSDYITKKDKKLFKKYLNKLDTFDEDTKIANEKYIKSQLENNDKFFSNIDGKSLDSQQRNAIVMDEDNLRVIAGAGTGKTLTIQGKVKYLIEKRNVSPNEILAISYSRASVNDLRKRIPEPINISTFHSLGKEILSGHDENYRPESDALNKVIYNYLHNKALTDENLSKRLIEYFSYFINIPIDDTDVSSKGEFYDKLKHVDFNTLKSKVELKLKNEEKLTLNLEIVKSFEELYIANFFYIHGINYTYEKYYTAINENYDFEVEQFKNFIFDFEDKDLTLEFKKEDEVIKRLVLIDTLYYCDLNEKIIENNLIYGNICYDDLKNKKLDTLEEIILSPYVDIFEKAIKDETLSQIAYCAGIEYDFIEELDYLRYILFNYEYDLVKSEDIPEVIKNEITKSILNKSNIITEVIEYENYRPDFYLNDYDIYLEHFGVDRDCNPNWLSEDEFEGYKNNMEWKRNLHKKYGTKLIETYSYYQSENRLLKRLEEKLLAEGVEFKEIKYRAIYRKLLENESLKEFKSFKKVLSTFIELFKGNAFKKEKFKEFYQYNEKKEEGFDKNRTKAFLLIVEDLYDNYQEYLKHRKTIDFNDMINNASESIVKKGLIRPYKYIIVDEFQDTSYTRFNFLKTMQNALDAKVMVVGDDWQSIYGFSGCDVKLFTDFDSYCDMAETKHIEKTYRNSQALIDVSGNFIMKNPNQSKKSLKSDLNLEKPVKILYYMDKYEEILTLEYIIKKIALESPNEEILILGRNKRDIEFLLEDENKPQNLFEILDKSWKNKYLEIRYNKNLDLNIKYMTVHGSKGLEATNVILINLTNKRYGFPNKMEDDPVLTFVKRNSEDYGFAEERRLFYVALTRTKNNVYLMSPLWNKSEFVNELEDSESPHIEYLSNFIDEKNKEREFGDILENEKIKTILTDLKCPDCETGSVLLKIKKENGVMFFSCSHWQSSGLSCEWDGGFYNGELDDLNLIDYCKECNGIYHKANGLYGGQYFKCSVKGCSGNNEIKTHLKCPSCGEQLTHVIRRHDNKEYLSCKNKKCDWFDGVRTRREHLKYAEICPKCGGIRRVVKGKYGLFVSCSEWKRNNCNGSIDFDQFLLSR